MYDVIARIGRLAVGPSYRLKVYHADDLAFMSFSTVLNREKQWNVFFLYDIIIKNR